MGRGEYFLGIDLGTSSVKATALSDRGEVLAQAGEAYPSYGAELGRAEQECREWLAAIEAAIGDLARAGLSLSSVRGLGLSAQMPTLVVADREGRARRRAIVWSDPRADSIGAELLARFGAERHYGVTGVVLDGRYLAPMFEWVASFEADTLPERPLILSAKDYLYMWLTGEACTDPSTASGFGLYSLASGGWDEALLREAGIPAGYLPRVAPAESAAGSLREPVASRLGLPAGIPVAVGAADSVAGVLGMGGSEGGEVCQMAGSSTAIVAISDVMRLHPSRRYLVTPLALAGSFGLEADLLSTGTSMAWLARALGCPGAGRGSSPFPAELEAAASGVEPGSEGLFFFPYLAGGEQGVLWDPALRGGLSGLSMRHGPEHLVRALHEGICFEERRCLEAFAEAGYEARLMLCSGPIARSPLYLQTLADACGLECRSASVEDASAVGAALLAGMAAGAWGRGDLPSLRPAGGGRAYLPSEREAGLYSALYRDYLELSRASRAP